MPDGGLSATPRANRVRIAFFGLRNAGKSTLVNAFAGQEVAIVSDIPGTTTDPVSKTMEILPLGPCLLTDTAGLDDVGALGAQRVERTLAVLATADIAVWVTSGADGDAADAWRARFDAECRKHGVTVFEYRRGDSVGELKKKIAAVKLADAVPGLLEGLVSDGDRVVCVCPIDAAAPKGRLILPQVQVIRECLDRHLVCTVCQPGELERVLGADGDATGTSRPHENGKATLVVTDSQAFREVKRVVAGTAARLTSFSILFARQKGDLAEYERGVAAIANLKDGDTVLVAEGCTHHRQCNDIGTTRIPKALEKLSGKKLNFVFVSGNDFTLNPQLPPLHSQPSTPNPHPALVVHCGGCMLTRREVLRRIGLAQEAGVPIANYGLVLNKALNP